MGQWLRIQIAMQETLVLSLVHEDPTLLMLLVSSCETWDVVSLGLGWLRITLPTKVCLVKAIVFLVVTYGCESWTINKAEY